MPTPSRRVLVDGVVTRPPDAVDRRKRWSVALDSEGVGALEVRAWTAHMAAMIYGASLEDPPALVWVAEGRGWTNPVRWRLNRPRKVMGAQRWPVTEP